MVIADPALRETQDEQQQRQFIEFLKSQNSAAYFINEYVKILDPGQEEWKPFKLWPAQHQVLTTMQQERQVLVLKARQLGLSWLTLAYGLHLGIFSSNSVTLIFSKSDTEATELLRRIKGMHTKLPQFLQPGVLSDNNHQYEFDNGSMYQAFATSGSGGRSYTANLVIVDEADFIENLARLITSVKPTIDAAGQLVMISTSNKDLPNSRYKEIYRGAGNDINDYVTIFLPWSARPDRDLAWYERVKRSGYSQDELYQEYPETPEQALMGRMESKRFRLEWIEAAFVPKAPIASPLPIPGLILYEEPEADRVEGGIKKQGGNYLIVADTSEGDVTSDPSPATIFNVDTWEEAGHLWGIFEPSVLAGYLNTLGIYFNNAVICVERNNHGHAVNLALETLGYPRLYLNPFDEKQGWLSNLKNKPLAIDKTAEALSDGSLILHTEAIKLELANLEAGTLKAPVGDRDDRAMTIIIGVAALVWPTAQVDPRGSRSYSLKASAVRR